METLNMKDLSPAGSELSKSNQVWAYIIYIVYYYHYQKY